MRHMRRFEKLDISCGLKRFYPMKKITKKNGLVPETLFRNPYIGSITINSDIVIFYNFAGCAFWFYR